MHRPGVDLGGSPTFSFPVLNLDVGQSHSHITVNSDALWFVCANSLIDTCLQVDGGQAKIRERISNMLYLQRLSHVG